MQSRAIPILSAAAALAFAPSHALTLHEAQDILFKENPDLAVLRLEADRAREQVREAKAAWYPSVDALGNYSYTTETPHFQLNIPGVNIPGFNENRPIGDHDRTELGVDASYALFTGFARERNVDSKRAGAEAKDAQWRGAKNQVSLRLGSLFYAWQLAGSQAAYQQKVLQHARDAQKQLQDFVRAGTAVRSRALAAEAKSKASEAELRSLENTRDSLAYEVLNFLGAPDSLGTPSPDILTMDTTAPSAPAWTAADSLPAAQRPETEALDHSMDQARYGSKALLGQKLPQVYGSAGVRYANPGLDQNVDKYMSYGQFALQLRWNLFDGSKNSSQRKQLDLQARELREQKRKLEQDWRKVMVTSRLQYTRWSDQFEAAKASQVASEAAEADVKRQFQAGVATELDWLEARNNTSRAEMLMEQARTMQRLALLQWDYAAGKELRF
jgi:outer membrane protein TolC